MSHLKKISWINMGLLLIYTLIINFATTGSERELAILIGLCILIIIHVSINAILCIVFFIQKNKELGKAFLLNALLVLIIGFSTCLGSSMI